MRFARNVPKREFIPMISMPTFAPLAMNGSNRLAAMLLASIAVVVQVNL